ncbi:hypothetical protein EC988_004076 [Linderina pennispora]|nr:hypothetical protein EC988_004076 [Linderina pennispora]
MPRSSANNTIIPLLKKLSDSLGTPQAKNELRWLVEHARTTIAESNKPHHDSPKLLARLWRNQPAPSEEELELDRQRLTPVQWAWLRQAVHDRTKHHKPLQYIIGDQQFGKTNVRVRPPVLIPRWETEEWMLRLAEMIKADMVARDGGEQRSLSILDACTGTGCLALGLASELPDGVATIVGADISDEAVELANENLAFNEMLLSNSVEFQRLDLQAPNTAAKLLGLKTTWDMIISNPPYVTPAEYRDLDPDVKDWEDRRSLVPLPYMADPVTVKDEELDPSGIAFIVNLAKMARQLGLDKYDPHVGKLPRLVVEIGGEHQVEPVRQAMHDQGLNSTEVWKDMAGTDRVVLGYVKP